MSWWHLPGAGLAPLALAMVFVSCAECDARVGAALQRLLQLPRVEEGRPRRKWLPDDW